MCRTRSGDGGLRAFWRSQTRRFLAAGASSGGSTTSFRSGPAGPTGPASPSRSDGGADRRRRHCVHALDRGRLARPEAAPGPRRALRREASRSRSRAPCSGSTTAATGLRRSAPGMPRPCSASPTPRACSRPTALRLGAAARADGTPVPSLISLDEVVAGELEPASPPETRTEAAAPVVSASRPEAAAPPAEPASATLLRRPRLPARRSPHFAPGPSRRHRLRARRRSSSRRLRRSARSSAGRTPSRPSPAPDYR